MADLAFAVTGARPLEHAAVPTLAFRLDIARTGGGPVRSVTLTTTVRIAAARRRYAPAERLSLARVFGQDDQWAAALRPLAWARLTTTVPPFDDSATVDLPVPCTHEGELAVTSYFDAVRDTVVPLDFLFNGTVFHTGADGALRTSQICWARESSYDLPAGLWHSLTARYFGGTRWLRVSREAHDDLAAYRDRHALADWDTTVRALLDGTAPVPAPEGAAAWTR
ncbi:hypothetical protein BLA24_05015 [Streptomyces cinnamoneus]|uniref:Uncharacterized protein n=1 Tax=Streptomyces cinnamoneus TaxID=53446 RepID=A0A2G1XP21_STRCJ|nr:hypothetical protein BLA24_05015 [Streptomyces cinnamoneus]PPT11505.1 hypothetical protein CYQ11_28515 [Streptomyces cinnamoneus]